MAADLMNVSAANTPSSGTAVVAHDAGSTRTGLGPSSREPRSRWRLPYGVVAKTVVGATILLLWEAGVRLFAPPYAARPTETIPAVPSVLLDERFREALTGTLGAIVQGLVLAIISAMIVGIAMGRVGWLEWTLKGYHNAAFALPMVAVVPLVTMWLGYTEGARLAIIYFSAYLPMALNVYDGARSVPRDYLEVAATYRARRRDVWLGIVIPASVPYLLAGFRLASGRALVAAVVVEYLIGIPGLGFYILVNARTFHHNEAMVAVLVLTLIGVGIIVGVRAATARLTPWYRPATLEE